MNFFRNIMCGMLAGLSLCAWAKPLAAEPVPMPEGPNPGIEAESAAPEAEDAAPQMQMREREDAPDVKASGLNIVITVSKPGEASVYSMLGQLVAHVRLAPGTTRVALGTPGIYIVRIADRSYKLALR